MDVTWLDKLHAAEHQISNLRWMLADLSDRLAGVGFERLSKEADALSTLASKAEENVKEGTSAVLTENLNNARDMTATVVGLALNLSVPNEHN